MVLPPPLGAAFYDGYDLARGEAPEQFVVLPRGQPVPQKMGDQVFGLARLFAGGTFPGFASGSG